MLKVKRGVHLRTGKGTKQDSGMWVIAYANNVGESACEKFGELHAHIQKSVQITYDILIKN